MVECLVCLGVVEDLCVKPERRSIRETDQTPPGLFGLPIVEEKEPNVADSYLCSERKIFGFSGKMQIPE